MVKEFFFYLLVSANVINMSHLGLYIVGANIYDVRAFWRVKRSPDIAHKTTKRRPLVSIVVPAHNEELVIKRTLDSIRRSTYSHIEIIIVDDGSTDKTASIVRKYIKQSPLLRVESYMARYSRSSKLMRRYVRAHIARQRIVLLSQTNAGKAAAMNNAIANHVRGKFVMCLDADSILHPQAVERAVKYFDNPEVMGVAANVRVMESKKLIGIVQRFEHMIGYRSKKFYTLTNSEFIVGGVASTYRTKVLRKVNFYDTDTLTEDIGLSIKLTALLGNRKHRIIYAADVVAETEGVHTFKALMRQRYRWKMGCLQNMLKYRYLLGNADREKYSRMLTWYRLPMAFLSEFLLLLEPVILGYVIYLSIRFHTIMILIGAYVTITIYVLWTLWPDEHLSVKEKLKLSLQSFEIYLLFYMMDVVQVVAIIRCVINYRTVVKRNGASTWISPARAAQTA
jgi:cellulose synthase/poly-beta-1,6-N-acetylglucosamine synthase-like glycosyltransferase